MMASSLRKSEIVEVKDNDFPILNKIPTKYLENDINKLFEAVNLRTSKSLDLSDSWRNSSKKTMRTHSPGIGFSKSVSLKQALRGLSISQAAEMAAVKRLSMASASPRISEVSKITNLSLPVSQSGHSSPRFVSSVVKDTASFFSHTNNVPISDTQEIRKLLPNSSGETTPLKITDITTSKPKPKSRLQNVSSYNSRKSNKEIKLTKNTSRVRSVNRKKNAVIKKSMKLALATRGNSKKSYEANSAPDLKQLTCQRCQCSLKDAKKCDSLPITPAVNITNMPPKSRDKGDISKSSKSSICDFSSSTTSFSEDSNLSSSTRSRPHMSKDVRWKAIERVRKQYGFVGLSHFNLLKKLGAGDIGMVYLAEVIGTSCPFAIKVMDNEELGKRKKMARAQTDREIIGMLDHPFLPTLYAQFTSDNLSCLVMEYCPGGDLHVLRQKQPGRFFSEHAARFYAAEVLLALEYLHMLGIVYRDLKPENILVREDGHIMLTDFDLSLRCSVNPTILKSSSSTQIDPPRISGQCAGSNCIDPFCSGPSCQVPCFSPKLLHKSRKPKPNVTQAHSRSLPQLVAEPTEARSNSFVGTHEYLAPEIVKCEGHGSAVDWWTFGVFLYELLYGKTPFKGPSNDETLANVVKQRLIFPNTQIVSSQARDLIRGLLVKDPENRLGTETGAAEIKRHPFFEGLNWALVRCAIPPQIPEQCDVGKEKTFTGYNVDERHVEFELF